MKKLLLLAALVALVFMPAVAQADTVTVGETLNIAGGFSAGRGRVDFQGHGVRAVTPSIASASTR